MPTEKQIKDLMIKLISYSDDSSKDEWYVTDRDIMEIGIKALAHELNIELNLDEEVKPPTLLTVSQLKRAVKYDRPILYELRHRDPSQENIRYVGVVNDTQDKGYYGLSSEEVFDLDMDPFALCTFELDGGIETYSKAEGVDYK